MSWGCGDSLHEILPRINEPAAADEYHPGVPTDYDRAKHPKLVDPDNLSGVAMLVLIIDQSRVAFWKTLLRTWAVKGLNSL